MEKEYTNEYAQKMVTVINEDTDLNLCLTCPKFHIDAFYTLLDNNNEILTEGDIYHIVDRLSEIVRLHGLGYELQEY